MTSWFDIIMDHKVTNQLCAVALTSLYRNAVTKGTKGAINQNNWEYSLQV